MSARSYALLECVISAAQEHAYSNSLLHNHQEPVNRTRLRMIEDAEDSSDEYDASSSESGSPPGFPSSSNRISTRTQVTCWLMLAPSGAPSPQQTQGVLRGLVSSQTILHGINHMRRHEQGTECTVAHEDTCRAGLHKLCSGRVM